MRSVTVGCVIAGGGPAGMTAGLLLARAGIDVVVLEKHHDFNRDFRGDTVHPSTIRLLDELGLGPAFDALPQSRLEALQIPAPDGGEVRVADFGRLAPPYNYVALVPQWDLLNLLAHAAGQEPAFELRMDTEAIGIIGDGRRVTGVRYRDSAGDGVIETDLVLACDGRASVLRAAGGLVAHEYPVLFDTWWFRLPRRPDDPEVVLNALIPRFADGDIVLSLPRDNYHQIAYLGAKGSDARLRAEGIERFRERIARLRPDFADRLHELASTDDLHLLDVRLDRLRRWHRPGLLCIGDAAHAMSPAGGVGINLAVQDAVAAATLLAGPLSIGRVTEADLHLVQRRRLMPTVVIQAVQRVLQRIVFAPILSGEDRQVSGSVARLLRRFPALATGPARLVGFGPRPEHAPDFARRPDP